MDALIAKYHRDVKTSRMEANRARDRAVQGTCQSCTLPHLCSNTMCAAKLRTTPIRPAGPIPALDTKLLVTSKVLLLLFKSAPVANSVVLRQSAGPRRRCHRPVKVTAEPSKVQSHSLHARMVSFHGKFTINGKLTIKAALVSKFLGNTVGAAFCQFCMAWSSASSAKSGLHILKTDFQIIYCAMV